MQTQVEYNLRPLDQAETTETLQRYVDDAVADGWSLHTVLPKLIVFQRTVKKAKPLIIPKDVEIIG